MIDGTARLWAGVVLFLVLAGAYIALTLAQAEVAPLMLLGGPLVTYLLLGAQLASGERVAIQERTSTAATLEEQNATLDAHTSSLATISRQTNGVLDARIREAAGAAVIAHLVGAAVSADPSTPAEPLATSGDLSP